ncbi:hypothetical protein [Companilactobacillus sp.]|uniref:hypothetical protein n=1 Tax=Companilactobacillus sp. TaxID=2767905 RepID=UPI0025B89558|nr:hypothetical protein [Companilactobacillus sp.]MCH4008963.1 hypothetical protein [Companilactobacillus sp.]MCH4050858.1 hypothetical protein [Companilactobacillus sp.]MCH4076906.1 hypothetical protein [Companilactobacillus sp.]MCH4125481.1 hypothetical protein [Companilactobacillus sp.]MCI1311190.1 hypothetical protein [Companilactobacillus sp.]
MKKQLKLLLVLQLMFTVVGFVFQIKLLAKLLKIEDKHHDHKCHHCHHGHCKHKLAKH